MSDHRTHGDTSVLPCPWCGKDIRDLWDYGNLADGDEIECEHCERKVKLVYVGYLVHVVADRVES